MCVYVCVCGDVLSLSQAKYHEEFERSRGRGATHTLDEQHMARLHGDQLIGVGDGYHGVQPQVVEMDRRSAGAAGQSITNTVIYNISMILFRRV